MDEYLGEESKTSKHIIYAMLYNELMLIIRVLIKKIMKFYGGFLRMILKVLNCIEFRDCNTGNTDIGAKNRLSTTIFTK